MAQPAYGRRWLAQCVVTQTPLLQEKSDTRTRVHDMKVRPLRLVACIVFYASSNLTHAEESNINTYLGRRKHEHGGSTHEPSRTQDSSKGRAGCLVADVRRCSSAEHKVTHPPHTHRYTHKYTCLQAKHTKVLHSKQVRTTALQAEHRLKGLAVGVSCTPQSAQHARSERDRRCSGRAERGVATAFCSTTCTCLESL